MDFTALEQAVLDWLASHRKVANLAEQLATCRPTERDLTGVGSFTKLVVPADRPRIDLKSICNPIMGPWIEESEGIQHGGMSLLFLDESGYVKTLELVANGEHVDESVSSFVLHEWIEQGAPPNGGPATPLGNSGAAEGPPSVS